MDLPKDVDTLLRLFDELGVKSHLVDRTKADLVENPGKEETWIDLAIILRQEGEYHAALACYDAALKHWRNSHRLWGNRGKLLRMWERYEEAISSFKKALEIAPTYVHAIFELAYSYEVTNHFAAAMDLYAQVVALQPDNAEAVNNLGNCHKFSGNRQRAEELFLEAARMKADYTYPLFNLAATYFEDRRFSEALKYIDRLLELDPLDQEAVALRTRILDRPETPEKSLPASGYAQSWLIRPSPNYQIERSPSSSARKGKVKLVEADLTYKESLSAAQILAMDRDKAAAIAGYRTWDIFKTQELLRKAALERPAVGEPRHPRLFISYRWESEDHKRWVWRLADDLVDRGYDVILDRYLQSGPERLTVPEMVSLLTTAQVFVPILTEQYRRCVEPKSDRNMFIAVLNDGWVLDEWQSAMWLTHRGLIAFAGIWRSGPVVPAKLPADAVYDFRDDNAYVDALDRSFPHLFVMVIGIRKDHTGRMIGPVHRADVESAIATLRSRGNFDEIVLRPVSRGGHGEVRDWDASASY